MNREEQCQSVENSNPASSNLDTNQVILHKAANSHPTASFDKPIFNGRLYSNPSTFTAMPGLLSYLKFKWEKLLHGPPKLPTVAELEKNLPVLSPRFNLNTKLSATWLGHATLFIHLDDISFITDPVWANRSAPTYWKGYERYRPSPCAIDDLPPLDFVLISHNHYDHLDSQTVSVLAGRFPHIKWFVPEGLGKWLRARIESNQIYEISWGEHASFLVEGEAYQIWCIPAQHWSSRNIILDRNISLWCGWVVVGPSHKFYYAGDTGFCKEVFRKLGNNLGPFDLSAIPIGCYAPRWFAKSMHIDPSEAVEIHLLTQSIHTIGVHWGTYNMGSMEPYLEPATALYEAAAKKGITPQHIFTLPHGGSWCMEQIGSDN
ncbi:MAG: MBL fold metallo-hydrolase [Candidatus Cardinium sp.]|nr:MBL fold metallo-hydrolase [Candidatus Cardinium sp.]